MPLSAEEKLRRQRKITEKWVNKVDRIRAIIDRCDFPSNARGGSKPTGIFAFGALGAVNNMMRSVPGGVIGAEQALVEIGRIVEEE